MTTHLNPIKTGPVTWTVTVSPGGVFCADATGMAPLTAMSYEELKQRCKDKAAKTRVKVSIPYVRFSTENGVTRAVHGTATGIHAKTREVLTREPGGTDQVSGIGGYRVPMDAADESRVIEIMNAESALHAERIAILAKYKFGTSYDGLKKVVQGAIDAALAAKASEAGSPVHPDAPGDQ